jgi:hypothetical protein
VMSGDSSGEQEWLFGTAAGPSDASMLSDGGTAVSRSCLGTRLALRRWWFGKVAFRPVALSDGRLGEPTRSHSIQLTTASAERHFAGNMHARPLENNFSAGGSNVWGSLSTSYD